MSEDASSPPPPADAEAGGATPPPYVPPVPPRFVPPAPTAPAVPAPPAGMPAPVFPPPGAPGFPPPGAPALPPLGGTAPLPPPTSPPPYPAPAPSASAPAAAAPTWGTHWSAGPGAPLPPAAEPSRPRGALRVLWAVLALVALACIGGAALLYWQTTKGPDHPDSWDPRVADLVDFVQQERGQDFEHPVAVNFLTPEEYAEATGGVGAEPTDEDREGADEQAGLFRALGLMSGEVDLIESSNDLFEDGTAAYYDSISEQVYVNGEGTDDTISPATAVTVVHELTHALQDQLVDLDGIEMDDDGPTTDWSDAHLAVVEGDAMVVEQAYVAQLSDADFDAYTSEWDALVDESEQAKADNEVPAALDVFFGLPYVFGPSWVLAAQAEDAQARIDSAIGGDVPPSVAILDLVVDGPSATRVESPSVPSEDDDEELYTDTFGAMSWLVVLGEHNDSHAAIDAVTTWKGDGMVVYRNAQDRVCFSASVDVGDEPTPSDGPFAVAARAWADALPAESTASVTVSGSLVELVSCDPGADVDIPLTGQAQAAVDELGLRNAIVTSVLSEGDVDLEWAGCYADGLIEQFGVERLNSEESLVDSPEFTAAAAQLAASCGVPG